jgi:hypothetical protein
MNSQGRLNEFLSAERLPDGLKSEVQHPASGKVHRCKPVRHTDSFSRRST